MRLLLHTCCGPCFLGVWEELGTRDLEVTNYFYNPNIFPEAEYNKRLEHLRKAVAGKTAGLVEAKYEPEAYDTAVTGLEQSFPERCPHCYRLRLEKVAKYAKAHGFDAFSTTLLVSPYQQHEMLAKIGVEVAAKHGVDFYYSDWRPYFREGQNEARSLDLYRQKYCGCKHSLNQK